MQAPANSGVTINGVVAAIYGGHFYANNVALEHRRQHVDGHAHGGRWDDDNANDHGDTHGIESMFASRLMQMQGFSPLIVNFDITPQDGVVIQKVEIDADRNSTVDQTLPAFPWISIMTYTGAGAYMTTFRVTDTQGNVYSQVVPDCGDRSRGP